MLQAVVVGLFCFADGTAFAQFPGAVRLKSAQMGTVRCYYALDEFSFRRSLAELDYWNCEVHVSWERATRTGLPRAGFANNVCLGCFPWGAHAVSLDIEFSALGPNMLLGGYWFPTEDCQVGILYGFLRGDARVHYKIFAD